MLGELFNEAVGTNMSTTKSVFESNEIGWSVTKIQKTK